MARQHHTPPSRQTSEIELGILSGLPPDAHQSTTAGIGLIRPGSEEQPFDEPHPCDVFVDDGLASDMEGDAHVSSWYRFRPSAANDAVFARLKGTLQNRGSSSVRWINIIGWSSAAVNEISRQYLGEHDLLSLENWSQQMLGGPTCGGGRDEFAWIQSQVWFSDDESVNWSSMSSVGFRMAVSFPTPESPGTLITNFLGHFHLASKISDACRKHELHHQPYGKGQFGSVWILAFSILRMLAGRLDFALQLSDPVDANEAQTIPSVHRIPLISEKARNLSSMVQYLSTFDELVSFLVLCQATIEAEQTEHNGEGRPEPEGDCFRLRHRVRMEVLRTQNKIKHQQKLCQTYLKRIETLIQMTISYSTIQMTERLDEGRYMAERLSRVGLLIAALAVVLAPVNLLTSYYGMNVQEFSSGATISLYEFWKFGMPVVLISLVSVGFIGIWVWTNGARLLR